MHRVVLVIFGILGIGCDAAPSSTPVPTLPHAASPDVVRVPVTFDALFHRYVISSHDKQLSLWNLHDEGDWSFDKKRGKLKISGLPAYSIQILGSEDHVNRTWLWGWANPASNVSDSLLEAALELKSYGKKHNIRQLTRSKLSMDDVDGYRIGLIASGFCDAKAYYRCPYENGALFVLITDERLRHNRTDLARAVLVIPQAIGEFGIDDQPTAVASYLDDVGLKYRQHDRKLVIEGKDGGQPQLVAEFDDANRLLSLEGQLTPKSSP